MARNELSGVLMTVRKILHVSAYVGVVTAMITAIVFTPDFSRATDSNQKPSDKKFMKDLESIFGATVKTKHGLMTLRQRKDPTGRVRKQIITGPGFSEIQLDQNGDGTVDLLEVTRGVKTVTVSQPHRGRFLRLEIAERTTRGLNEALYLLSLNGRTYNLVQSRMTGNEIIKRAESGDAAAAFVADDRPAVTAAPSSISADLIPTSASAQNRPLGLTPEQEQSWYEQQERTLGADYMCNAEQSGVATLQRDWWKVLKFDVKEQTDALVEKLKTSTMFDASCKTPARKKDFDAMANGLAVVMLSSSVGQPLSTDKTRGRFLRCLELSGLGPTAARIEESFMRTINPGTTPALIKCEKSATGATRPATTAGGEVTMFMTAADQSKKKNKYGSPLNYQNVLLHELMHVANKSIHQDLDEEEEMMHTAQACCGDPSDNRPGACNKLDTIVAQTDRLKTIESHLLRVTDGITPIQVELENLFSPSSANKLYKNFLFGLDEYKKGSPPAGEFEEGLLSSNEFQKCVAFSSVDVCKAKWTENIRNFAEEYFAKKCKSFVDGNEKSKCRKISPMLKDNLASSIAASMFEIPPGSKMCKVVVRNASESDQRRLLARFFDFIVGVEVKAIDDDCVPPADLPAYTPPSDSSLPGNESRPSTNVGVDPATEVKSVTSGTAAPAVEDRNNGNDSLAGGSSGGSASGRDRSPIPVTRVDSPTSGRTVAEDRYRRATDIVGSIGRSALPNAVAGERDSRSARLGPDDGFIPFKPSAPKDVQKTLDNPFASKRSIASIGTISAQTTSTAGAVPAARVGAANAGETDAAPKQNESPNRAGAFASRKKQEFGGAANATVAPGAGMGAGASMLKAAGLEKPKTDVLDGLFTLPYRQVARRLKQLEVVEALVTRKISVQDDSGRVLGSNRPREQYKFTDFEKPLSKQGKR